MPTPPPMMLWSVSLFLLLLLPQGVIPDRLSAAQAAEPRFISQYEVDPDRPQIPAQWKLGDPSSFAVDGEDHVWLLHRPRTLSNQDFSSAAPHSDPTSSQPTGPLPTSR